MAKEVVKNTIDKEVICDLKLTINGHELDIKSFVEHWESQVDRMIRGAALDVVRDRFRDVTDIKDNLEERLMPEIEKRLEDWEKEHR